MSRYSRSKEKATSLRPRPVTATVTKPSWMRPEAIVGPRSRSVESNGSTASLTSVLDHDSYESCSDDEGHVSHVQAEKHQQQLQQQNRENVQRVVRQQQHIRDNMNLQEKKIVKKKVLRKFVEPSISQTDETETETEPGMSPWEQWLIQKVKDDRMKRREERMKKKEEKKKKSDEQALKERKERQAEMMRKEWVEKKNFEEKLKKKVECQRTKTEQMILDEQKKMQNVKAERKFNEWKEDKKREEKQKKVEEKIKAEEEEKIRKEQLIKAQEKFEEWCRKADQKQRPLPNSFGYTSGKLTGYHDSSAYPVPTFYNPMPWQPIHIPRQASDKKKRPRSKPKPRYVWNPEKYR